MKLVVDANILFSIANPISFTSQLIHKIKVELYSPEYALYELKKYEKEVVEKSNLKSFKAIAERLRDKIRFIPVAEIKKELVEMQNIISDEKDIIYLALAKKMNISIWSNDPHLKEQTLIQVLTTKEIVEIITTNNT
ncbi:MAG TPA: PIN domain-containing protein [Candidatus Nanoarchaeia archaeon]|nr:PIN domain-containing protein [Candidatus Nanoarchaeia archaeon]